MSDTANKRPTSRFVRVMLIGSLALNFLVIGGVIGVAVTADKHHKGRGTFAIGPFTQALDDATKEKVRDSLSRNMDERREADRRGARQAMQMLLASLKQEPFDRGQVEQALNAIEAQGAARRAEGTDALLDAVEQMTPDERAAFVERFEQQMRKRKSGDKPRNSHD
ncbi:periplasmic heavy metal sensor [Falsihalocynthiibacter sp. SS001]|uniref:periplasmic heavy metal sensor n=1 Tax=Falsihalocynthiibacter sp. SS001 TaxID=3349698 RepID=UPI0036D33F4D